MPDRPSPADIQLKIIVDAATRYSGAYAEINNRIALRQNLITIFTTVATAIVGFCLKDNKNDDPAIWRLVYAIPVFCVFFSVLMLMHEKQLGILRAFLGKLEKSEWFKIPSYHGVSKFSEESQKTRHPHDLMCFTLCMVYLIAAGFIWWKNQGHFRDFDVWVGGFSFAISLIFSVQLLSVRFVRDRIFRILSD